MLMLDFTVAGVPFIGLNGGPAFKHNEAFSFQIATDDQQETDRYWNAIVGNGGQESQCGWCKGRWGVGKLNSNCPIPSDGTARQKIAVLIGYNNHGLGVLPE